MILLIDNYDSFTWNLADLVRRQYDKVEVVRNDEISLTEIQALHPTGILLSPGPGTPKDSGISLATVHQFANKIPILGVCMGMQVIGEAFGAELMHADAPFHGKTSSVLHDKTGIFQEIPSPFQAMRYHSLVLNPSTLPQNLIVSAHIATGEIMGIRHTKLPVKGVQFHPESILTAYGEQLMGNWLAELSLKG